MSSNEAGTEDLKLIGRADQFLSGLTDLSARMSLNDLTLMQDEVLLELTTRLEQASRKLEALLVLSEGAVRDRCFGAPKDSLAGRQGCRDAFELLQRLSQQPTKVLRDRVLLAHDTRPVSGYSGGDIPARYPVVAHAFYAGDLPIATAQLITKTLGVAPASTAPERLAHAELSLVRQAAGYSDDWVPGDEGAAADRSNADLPVDGDTMKSVCAYWRSALDQDGTEPKDRDNLARRYFHIGSAWRGLVPIRGALLPEVAALLGNLITSVNSPKSRANTERPAVPASADAAEGADVVEGADANCEVEPSDMRSSGQKMHDALTVIAQAAVRAAEVPSLGGAPVTVLIQTTQAELAASLERDLERSRNDAGSRRFENAPPQGTTDLDEANSTTWLHGPDGAPVPVNFAAVRHAICAGSTQRVLVDNAGRILGIESPTRIFTPHQRRAIVARDGGCVIPGCTVPATWCEVHHVTAWSRGGKTTTDNGVLLCWWHHRSIEVSGWNIRMAEGYPEVRPPTWIDRERRWRRVRPLLHPAALKT